MKKYCTRRATLNGMEAILCSFSLPLHHGPFVHSARFGERTLSGKVYFFIVFFRDRAVVGITGSDLCTLTYEYFKRVFFNENICL
jgi:hypothetical protein